MSKLRTENDVVYEFGKRAQLVHPFAVLTVEKFYWIIQPDAATAIAADGTFVRSNCGLHPQLNAATAFAANVSAIGR